MQRLRFLRRNSQCGSLEERTKRLIKMDLVDKLFSYKTFRRRDGPDLVSLYDVTLLVPLPRKNLIPGRKFKHVLVDLEECYFIIYYRNDKSCLIYFREVE
jgi:hypothetical protein